VVLELRAAGIGSRLLAKGIDVVIQLVAVIGAVVVALLAAGLAGAAAGVVTVVVLLFLALYGYPTVLETWWDGQTVGKRALGIRVITVEGGPVGFHHSAIRAMMETFDLWFPTPGGLVALTSALLTKRSQRLGDLAAGTIVVRRPGSKPSPLYVAPPMGAHGSYFTLDTSRLEPAQYAAVRELLMRAGELQPAARHELAATLAARVADVMGTAHPAAHEAETFLASVLFVHQRRWAASGAGHLPPPPPPPPAAAWAPSQPHDLRTLPPPTGPRVEPGR
jgi:uncharacterized RDD family membrane protein YckC